MGLNPIGNPEWARNVTDTVERYVGLVRDNATSKAEMAIKAVVYGIIALFAGLVAAVLGLLIVTRLTQSILDAAYFSRATSVWLSYIGLGMLMMFAGLMLLRKARTPAAPSR
jgi:predicted small integral membrane protein